MRQSVAKQHNKPNAQAQSRTSTNSGVCGRMCTALYCKSIPMNFKTKWIQTGKVHDFVFLGKEVIGTASGNHVIFYNLVTGEERIEYFYDSERGEGACCLAGHPFIPVFSTTERRYNPKIYIHTYPEIRKVAVCNIRKSLDSYLSCCFTGTEYLLSLTSIPKFKLIVWFWRTGEIVAEIDTTIEDGIQTIEPSLTLNHLVYQFSPTSGKISTYEIYPYSKKVSILKNDIIIVGSKLVSVSWTSTGNLLLCDTYQNVYIASSDGKKYQLILPQYADIEAKKELSVLPFNNGFVQVDNNSRLTCYTKPFSEINKMVNWVGTWSIECPSHPIKIISARHKEAVLFHGVNGNVYEVFLIQNNKPEIKQILTHSQKLKFINLLKPLEMHIIVVDHSNNINIMNVSEGTVITTLQIKPEDEVVCMTTHPFIPFVAISTSSGKFICFDASLADLSLVSEIHLQNSPLGKIKFSKNGTAIGVESSDYFYLIKTIATEEVKVFFYSKTERPIVDFLIYEDGEVFQVLYLVETSSTSFISDYIEINSIRAWENNLHKMKEIKLSNMYQALVYGSADNFHFFSSPYLSKQLHRFNIENGYELIALADAISTSHCMRKLDINPAGQFVVTCGYDGYTIIRDSSKFQEVLSSIPIHHYKEGGTVCSLLLHKDNLIVSLGRNGSLVGTEVGILEKISKNGIMEKFLNDTKFSWKCKDISQCVANGDTWLEQEEKKILEKEAKEVLPLKKIVLEDLKTLKSKINKLLDANKNKSAESQLPVMMFDLNEARRNNKIKKRSLELENNKIDTQQQINAKEKIIEHLIQKYWNELEVHDCTLISFNNSIRVENFRLWRTDKPREMDDFYIELFDIISNQHIHPRCNDIDPSNLELPSSRRISEELSKDPENYLFLNHDDATVLSGSTSFRWIEGTLTNQLLGLSEDVTTYDFQNSKENRLKYYFNEKFYGMKSMKEELSKRISECLQKLLKYRTELMNRYGVVLEISEFNHINCHQEKNPENIIMTLEEDINLSSSPACLNFSDVRKKSQDDACNITVNEINNVIERQRSFREEQLGEMMGGVLEIRWEEEIKKDIPKPECLISKNPSNYDEKDIESIKLYDEKVNKLEADRDKYKTYLESEIHRIDEQIHADIENHDMRMGKLALEKIHIKSAILQEFLLRLNKHKNLYLKIQGDKKISNIARDSLTPLESKNQALMSEVNSLESVVNDLKVKYEGLVKRDKVVEGKFRTEFTELAQPLVEHLSRQYKRRPRIGQIACASLTCLTETNKCLMAGKKSAILPQEYLEFLRGMDALDIMPSTLPTQIDACLWQSLCKLRRSKVDVEIKMRIAALELAEAEQTFFYLQKLKGSIQSRIYFIKNSIEEETMNLTKTLENPDIQLVLKTSQIEISNAGSTDDFENATIVTCKQLIEVNNQIIEGGEKKVNTMKSLITLKKLIKYRNWKCKCMSKKSKHLKEHLSVLKNTKIGKEMRNFLVERLERKIRQHENNSCDKMLKSVEKKFQRMLKEEKMCLSRIGFEIEHWHGKNEELMKSAEQMSLEKQERNFILEDRLRKRNRLFRTNLMSWIVERNRLVEKVKESQNHLLNLQTELELLKLKTYPTLRFKDVTRCRRSNYSKKNSK